MLCMTTHANAMYAMEWHTCHVSMLCMLRLLYMHTHSCHVWSATHAMLHDMLYIQYTFCICDMLALHVSMLHAILHVLRYTCHIVHATHAMPCMPTCHAACKATCYASFAMLYMLCIYAKHAVHLGCACYIYIYIYIYICIYVLNMHVCHTCHAYYACCTWYASMPCMLNMMCIYSCSAFHVMHAMHACHVCMTCV